MPGRGPWRGTWGLASPAWALGSSPRVPRELPQVGLRGRCLWEPLPLVLSHCHPRAHSPAIVTLTLSLRPAVCETVTAFSSSLTGKCLFPYTSGSWRPLLKASLVYLSACTGQSSLGREAWCIAAGAIRNRDTNVFSPLALHNPSTRVPVTCAALMPGSTGRCTYMSDTRGGGASSPSIAPPPAHHV